MSFAAAVKSKNFSRIISNLKWLSHFSTFSDLKKKDIFRNKEKFRILLLYFYQVVLSPFPFIYRSYAYREAREPYAGESNYLIFILRSYQRQQSCILAQLLSSKYSFPGDRVPYIFSGHPRYKFWS